MVDIPTQERGVTEGDIRLLLEHWQQVSQREHEDYVAALMAFEKVHTQVASQCAVTQRHVQDQLEKKESLVEVKIMVGQWWRSLTMILLGVMGGLGTIGIPAYMHFAVIDQVLTKISERQDVNTAGVEKLRNQDQKMVELYQTMTERLAVLNVLVEKVTGTERRLDNLTTRIDELATRKR